ncbi:MAG: beta-galactosidase [Akkermansiaceae bacterium]|nr:beta-galactosidase [Akkermansiaceae bacterium]
MNANTPSSTAINRIRHFLIASLLGSLLLPAAAADTPAQGRRFQIGGDSFLFDGKPFTIRSGEMHIVRLHRWRQFAAVPPANHQL